MYATHHGVHHERSGVFDNEDHVLEGAKNPMCAPQNPEGDAHEAGIKSHLMQHLAEHKPRRGFKVVSNPPNAMRTKCISRRDHIGNEHRKKISVGHDADKGVCEGAARASGAVQVGPISDDIGLVFKNFLARSRGLVD